MIADSLKVLDSITLNFSQGGLLFMNITLAFIMFGVALQIKLDDFKKVISNPKSVIVGFTSQFFLLPLLTFIFLMILKPTPAVALGMILVAACPGGNISNFISGFAKGNVALSVTLTAIATLAAIFMTPFNFAFWGKLYAKSHPLLRPIEIDPIQMFQTVFILLGIPLILGMIFAYKFPNTTKKILKPINIFSIHLIIAIVFIQNGLGLLGGYYYSKILKLPEVDQRTISIETGIQNSGLGLVLIFNPKIFPPDLQLGGMAFIAAWWGIWHILSGLGLAYYWSRRPVKNS